MIELRPFDSLGAAAAKQAQETLGEVFPNECTPLTLSRPGGRKVPRRGVHPLEQSRRGDAGIVDEQIDRRPVGFEPSSQFRPGVRVANIENVGPADAARLADESRGFLGGSAVNVGRGDMPSVTG